MVTSPSPEFPKKSLQVMKQDDGKFFSRVVSKETSLANPSFRVYYGGVAGAIPFTWEIQPGTPKHKFSDNSLPPLTPPPSYYTNSQKPNRKLGSRSKLFNTILVKIHLKKAQVMTSSSSSSFPSSFSSWSSSYSSSSSTTSSNVSRSRRRFLSFGSLFDDGMHDDGHVYGRSSSPTSVHCFGSARRR